MAHYPDPAPCAMAFISSFLALNSKKSNGAQEASHSITRPEGGNHNAASEVPSVNQDGSPNSVFDIEFVLVDNELGFDT